MSHPDYLPTLREQYGPGAATRAQQEGPVRSSSIDHPDPTRPWTAHLMPADDAPDPVEPEPDDVGEWYGTRRVETVQPQGGIL